MNANELADFLEKHLVTSCAILGDVTATAIITTLRQQQAEIEALKKQKEPWYMVNKNGYVKPLDNDKIRELDDECRLKNNGILNVIQFTRAIEEQHGIRKG